MKAGKRWRPRLTNQEANRGWIFFALYFLVFPFLMGQIQRILDERWGIFFTDGVAGVLYHLVSVMLVFIMFWGFLKHGFDILLDWIPENLFAVSIGLVGGILLSLLVGLVPTPVENPLLLDYPQQLQYSPYTTMMILLVLKPIVEEVLFRGLLFGSLRQHSRVFAYAVSVLAFGLFSVWQFAFVFGDLRYLALLIQYIPMALALSWCYDTGGSIWSVIFLRGSMDACYLALIA